jgi:ferredoxin
MSDNFYILRSLPIRWCSTVSKRRWLTGLIMKTFPGRFTFARATRLPVIGGMVDKAFFDGDTIVYLPRNKVVEVNRAIFPGDQMFLPSEVIERFIEQSSYRVIMNWCICRRATGCMDYPLELGCLFLGEAARHIDPEWGKPASKEEAIAHMNKCREAGLVQLLGHNKIDSIWLGAKPHLKLMTICNCCPCCCLWKMTPLLSPEIGAKVTGMPGLEVVVTEKCKGCGACKKDCFVDAIAIVDGRARISGECRGCGRCAIICPAGAIEVHMGDVDRTVELIASSVDVS